MKESISSRGEMVVVNNALQCKWNHWVPLNDDVGESRQRKGIDRTNGDYVVRENCISHTGPRTEGETAGAAVANPK